MLYMSYNIFIGSLQRWLLSMNTLNELLRELRGKKTLREVAEITQLSHTYISDIEKGYRRGTKKPINPSPETLKRLAEAYDYPYEKLMIAAGYIQNSEPNASDSSNENHEEDLALKLEEMKELLKDDKHALIFGGEPLSDEAKESLLESIEYAFRVTERMNKMK